VKQAWERREEESDEAFAAFATYRDMGRQRSIDAAYATYVAKSGKEKRKRSKPVARNRAAGGWHTWSSRYEWVARASAYDDHMEAAELAARQKVREAEAAKWEARRLAQREREWTLGEKLQQKAEQLVSQELEARASDSAKLAETGSKLARLSAGMETDHQKVTGSISVMEINLSDKDDEQLRAYLGSLAEIAAKLAARMAG
jgi:hypothetical protein